MSIIGIRRQVRVLSAMHSACNSSQFRFVRYGTEYYMHDPRLLLLENTLDSPTDRSEHAQQNAQKCPTVVKTFLNAGTCRRQPTCAPISFSSARFDLKETT